MVRRTRMSSVPVKRSLPPMPAPRLVAWPSFRGEARWSRRPLTHPSFEQVWRDASRGKGSVPREHRSKSTKGRGADRPTALVACYATWWSGPGRRNVRVRVALRRGNVEAVRARVVREERREVLPRRGRARAELAARPAGRPAALVRTPAAFEPELDGALALERGPGLVLVPAQRDRVHGHAGPRPHLVDQGDRVVRIAALLQDRLGHDQPHLPVAGEIHGIR